MRHGAGSRTEAGPAVIPDAIVLRGPLAAEGRLLAMFEAGPDALVVVDRTRRMVLVNARLEQLFGYARAELIGRTPELLARSYFGYQPLAETPGLRLNSRGFRTPEYADVLSG